MNSRLKNERGKIFFTTKIWTKIPWNWKLVSYADPLLNLLKLQ